MSKKEVESGALPAWIMPNTRCWYKAEQYKEQTGDENMYNRGTIMLVSEKDSIIDFKLDKTGASMKVKSKTLYQSNEQNKEQVTGENDMVNMPVMNQPEILYNIKKRYDQNNIFTYIGPTLIVMNPYKYIKELFTPDKIKNIETLVRKSNNFQLSMVDPHVYAIAAIAFQKLFSNF